MRRAEKQEEKNLPGLPEMPRPQGLQICSDSEKCSHEILQQEQS